MRCVTFPVVRSRGPKQNEVVIGRETDRKALLTEAKLLVSLRTALTEFPFSSIQVVPLCQVFTQDVAAPDGVAGLWRLTDALPQLVEVRAGLMGCKLTLLTNFYRGFPTKLCVCWSDVHVSPRSWLTTTFPPIPWLLTVTPSHWLCLLSLLRLTEVK